MKNNAVTHLLWTGGWDSTFRLLDLLLIKGKTVQPYFLITRRSSNDTEIQTMESVRQRLFNKLPKTKKLLLPTIFRKFTDCKPNKEIETKFAELRKLKRKVGGQYRSLATFAHEINVDGIEMCIVKSEGISMYNLLKPFVYSSGNENDPLFRLKDDLKDTPLYAIFKYYLFPVLELTKLDMGDIAKKEGFSDFLELSWFCHNPRKDGKQCGICSPCISAIKSGLGARLPFFLHANDDKIIYIKNKSLEVITLKDHVPRLQKKRKILDT